MAEQQARTIALGAARVTVINIGDALVRLADDMNVPESVWRPEYADVFDSPQLFPSQCIHIALPGVSALIDVGEFEASYPADSPYRAPSSYTPPPSLIEQLASIGVQREDITHVVITHAHFDHYSGVTTRENGEDTPTFPHARCYLRRADWETPEMREALRDPDSPDSSTLGALHRLGLLELVEEDRDLTPEIRLIATPGETPGHQIVRISSGGQALYCLGDLYHHPVEVEHPEWMASWADVAPSVASRRALMDRALAENALLVAAHIAAIGRLERTATGVRWVAD